MKALSSILSTLGLVLTLILASGAAHAQSEQFPVIRGETRDVNLGTIPLGQPVEFYFDFENTGNAPLLIQHARGTRRDLKITFFDQFVVPGSFGYIEGVVQTHRPGFGNSSIVIYSNSPYQTQYVDVRWVPE